MKVGMQVCGSEGDVRPFLALAHGLRTAGHDVTLVTADGTNTDFTAIAERLGVVLRAINYDEYLDRDEILLIFRRLFRTRDVGKQLQYLLTHLAEPVREALLSEAKTLCAANDLVIGNTLVYPLKIAAIQQDRPLVMVWLQPTIPSRFVRPIPFPDMGQWLNAWMWRMGDWALMWRIKSSIDPFYRREGIPPERRLLHGVWTSPLLNLVASSPALFPAPPDWSGRYHLCGFFNLPDSEEPYRMPDDLAHFLDNGDPPVYMTFGSMLAFEEHPREGVAILLEAARIAGCRAIIQANWHDFSDLPESPDVYRIIRAPHHAIFPRCQAVVHHGGAGTTQAATRAGCPSIVVEYFGDQLLWGTLLHRDGIAPKMLHRRSVTAPKLARAIRTVCDTPSMREKAQHVGAKMRQEDGVARAVELIEQIGG